MSKRRELLFSLTRADFEWDYFRVGGSGGQNRDKRNTGVRCRHDPSGAVGECREHRQQGQNRRAAFRRCCESEEFQNWIRRVSLGRALLEDIVDDEMREENLEIEYYTS